MDPDPISSALSILEVVLEYVGTVSFAISGAVAAGRKGMDVVGVIVLACIVSVGGGTIRDLLVGRTPVFWIENPTFLLVGTLTALGVMPLTRIGAIGVLHRFQIVQISDAAGMALFVVIGTNIALASGASPIAAAVVGVICGVGGGIMRDVLADDIPEVLHNGQMYATAAFIGALIYIGLLALGLPSAVVFWVPIVIILALRLAAIFLNWGVPRFHISSSSPPDESARW